MLDPQSTKRLIFLATVSCFYMQKEEYDLVKVVSAEILQPIKHPNFV